MMLVPGRILIRLGALLTLALVTVAAWAQSSNTPLGDVVKQPKPAKRAVRVITDEQVAHYVPPPPPEPQIEAAENAPPDDPDAVAKRIAELKESEEAQQQVIKHFEQLLADESLGVAQRRGYTDSLSHAKATLASYQRERTSLEQGGKPAKQEGGPDAAPKPSAPDTEKPH